MRSEMEELQESRNPITAEDLRILCIRMDWFTSGTNEQYEKLFQLNRDGASLDDLALVIWLCTPGWTKEGIRTTLDKSFFGAGRKTTRTRKDVMV